MSASARHRIGVSIRYLALAMVAALLSSTALALVGASEPGTGLAPRVLLLNSYSPTTGWSMQLTAGVREAVLAHFPHASLTVEYLADDVLPADAVSARVAERVQQEHERGRFAIVIAADDEAFEFALAQHDQILPGVPVVFCGVSDLPPGALNAHRLITGTIQVHDVSTVMATALRRHPDTRVLVVVHDLSPAGLAYREQVQSWTEDLQRQRPQMVVVFLSAAQYSTPELIEQVRVLPSDGLVLLTSWSQDREGRGQRLDDVLAQVARVSPVPVYGVTGSGSGFATSAARLEEAHQQGHTVGKLAVKVLQGVPPSEIPIRIVRATPELEAATYIEGDAPPAAGPSQPARPVPPTMPLSRPQFLVVCLLAAVLQTALIAMLFVSLRRRRQLHRSLEEAQRRIAQISDGAELAVLEWDVVTGAMTFNQRYADALGYLPEEIEPTRRRWEAMVHPDDMPKVSAALQECLDDHRSAYSVRYRMLTRTGTCRWILERGEVSARHPDGSPSRLLGIQVETDPPAPLDRATRK